MSTLPPTNDDPKDDDLADLMAALDALDEKSAADDAPQDESPPDDDADEGLARANLGALRPAQPTAPAPPQGAGEVDAPAKPKGIVPPKPNQDDPPAEPPPPIFHYRVAGVLSPTVELNLNTARQAAELDLAEMGIFALHNAAQAPEPDEAAIKTALETWAKEHLPLKLTLDSVEAWVEGADRFVAAWTLTPADALGKAQSALAEALKPHVVPIEDQDALAVAPRIIISDHTPARPFLHLMHTLQLHFSPETFTLSAVELLRVPEGDDRWEVAQKFPTP